jgi:hypothetical protein
MRILANVLSLVGYPDDRTAAVHLYPVTAISYHAPVFEIKE